MLAEYNDEKILFKKEYQLKWRDLHKIRLTLVSELKIASLPRSLADPVVIITSELVENAFKYSDKKLVLIILKYIHGDTPGIGIKIHHPVSSYKSGMLRQFLDDVTSINAAQDVNGIYLETLREASLRNTKANRFRLALVRKTAAGALVSVRKSLIYQPGISIEVIYQGPG